MEINFLLRIYYMSLKSMMRSLIAKMEVVMKAISSFKQSNRRKEIVMKSTFPNPIQSVK